MQATYDAYLQQTIEIEAGVENEAVRLALYFERKAPSITNAYKILADNALLAFTQTALGLPSGMSTADIDVQAAMIEKRLDVADLQDPEKLGKLVARFCALYDAGSNTATTSAAVTLLSTHERYRLQRGFARRAFRGRNIVLSVALGFSLLLTYWDFTRPRRVLFNLPGTWRLIATGCFIT